MDSRIALSLALTVDMSIILRLCTEYNPHADPFTYHYKAHLLKPRAMATSIICTSSTASDPMEDITTLGISTLEDVEQSVDQVKRSLQWTQHWLLTSIQVGSSPVKVEFDRRVMRRYSTYFSNFSLPTTAFAEQFMTTTDRLLNLTKAEVQMLDWIIDWCHQPVDDGAKLYEVNDTLTWDQWCYSWSLTHALHIAELHELTLDAAREKWDREEQLPPYTAIQYLYDLHHNDDTDEEPLWDEFVAIYAVISTNPIELGTTKLFVQAFVDDVIRFSTDYPDV